MTSFNLNSYVQHTLNSYLAIFPEENQRFTILEKQLTNGENIGSRKNFNGHMTACAYLINNRKCLKIHHIGLDKWLAPGGHREEGDNELYHTAMRELSEEAGIKHAELHPWHKEHEMLPLDIDTHYIPHSKKKNEDEHFHHDFRFVFVLNSDHKINLQEEEVSGYERVGADKFPQDPSSQAILAKLQDLNLL
ncbi:MAG: NUDIX domain-containing protein [candidate division SR1 bacterium]|nr:NUDIX domain-containing protein [candidate division SR1 bacterium]